VHAVVGTGGGGAGAEALAVAGGREGGLRCSASRTVQHRRPAPPRTPPHAAPANRYVVPLLWVPVAAVLLWQAVVGGGVPASQLPALIGAGVLAWQGVEYSLHRWLFHLKPTGPESIKWHFMLHGWVGPGCGRLGV
jgi:hypothetical protein